MKAKNGFLNLNSSSSSTWNRKNLPEPFSEVFGSLSRKVPSSSCGFNLESHYCFLEEKNATAIGAQDVPAALFVD